ncbi:MAG: hypothetical protein ACRDFS_01560 [Chloroflexota bacterium]
MKLTRKIVAALALASALVVFVELHIVPTQAAKPGGRPHAVNRVGNAYWQRRDLTTYAVSTLNVPRCGRSSLSQTLRQAGASRYVVLRSRAHHRLYFIRVRHGQEVMGVYAYKFGWSLPRGIWRARCVRPASPATRHAYWHGRVMRAIYGSTYPRE